MAAVGQDLASQLSGQSPQRPPQQPSSAKKTARPARALRSLDQVVAGYVVLQVTAQESHVRREPGDEFRFEVAASGQIAVQAAP